MTDLDQYRVDTKVVSQAFKDVRTEVNNLLNLTQKASESSNGVKVELVDENGNKTGRTITVGKGKDNQYNVRSFWVPVLNKITGDLYNYYRAAKSKPKSTKKGGRAAAFQSAKVVQDPAYNLFTQTPNLGRVNPALVGGVKIDATGNMLPGQLVDSGANNQLVSQFLQQTVYGQRIASQLVVSGLCNIYMYQNNQRGLAARNRGKPYVRWETTYQGATDEFYNAFRATFDMAAARAGQPKPGSGVYPLVSKDEFTNKFYSTIAAANVVNDDSQLPPPATPVVKAYTVLVKPQKERVKKAQKEAEKAARKANASEIDAARAGVAAWEDLNFDALAQQAIDSLPAAGITVSDADAQALGTYAAVDKLQYTLSHINDRNKANYAQLDKDRARFDSA